MGKAAVTEFVLLFKDKDHGKDCNTWLHIYPDSKIYIHCENEYAGSESNMVEVKHLNDITDMVAYLEKQGYNKLKWFPSKDSFEYFVTRFLSTLGDKPNGEFESDAYMWAYPGYGEVRMKGVKESGKATFEFVRTLPGGTVCKTVPVSDLCLDDDHISEVAAKATRAVLG